MYISFRTSPALNASPPRPRLSPSSLRLFGCRLLVRASLGSRCLCSGCLSRAQVARPFLACCWAGRPAFGFFRGASLAPLPPHLLASRFPACLSAFPWVFATSPPFCPPSRPLLPRLSAQCLTRLCDFWLPHRSPLPRTMRCSTRTVTGFGSSRSSLALPSVALFAAVARGLTLALGCSSRWASYLTFLCALFSFHFRLARLVASYATPRAVHLVPPPASPCYLCPFALATSRPFALGFARAVPSSCICCSCCPCDLTLCFCRLRRSPISLPVVLHPTLCPTSSPLVWSSLRLACFAAVFPCQLFFPRGVRSPRSTYPHRLPFVSRGGPSLRFVALLLWCSASRLLASFAAAIVILGFSNIFSLLTFFLRFFPPSSIVGVSSALSFPRFVPRRGVPHDPLLSRCRLPHYLLPALCGRMTLLPLPVYLSFRMPRLARNLPLLPSSHRGPSAALPRYHAECRLYFLSRLLAHRFLVISVLDCHRLFVLTCLLGALLTAAFSLLCFPCFRSVRLRSLSFGSFCSGFLRYFLLLLVSVALLSPALFVHARVCTRSFPPFPSPALYCASLLTNKLGVFQVWSLRRRLSGGPVCALAAAFR